MIIDKYSRIPVYEQIVAAAEKEILLGILKPMDRMPSVRELAVELSTNPNTIQKAYTELERRELCYSSPGQGRFVAADAKMKIKEKRMENMSDLLLKVDELVEAGISGEEIIEVIREHFDSGKQ